MRVLLKLLPRAFPRAFRSEFAPGMLDVMFADYDQARARGRGPALWCLVSTLSDVLAAALRERLNPTWIEPIARSRTRRWQVSVMLETWARDFTHATRSLLRAPGFTMAAVVTLALAIGANTTVFSVVDTVLIDPLAFPEPDRLVSIRASAPGSDLPEEFRASTDFYVQYRENAAALEDLGLFRKMETTVRAERQVDRLFVSFASPSLFSTLGVTPLIGRLPTEEDDEEQVVVLSHWLWTDWFGRDPSVLGRAVDVDGELMTVIGVMRPDFRFPEERTSLWVHYLPPEAIRPGAGPGVDLVGRLAPGVDHATLTDQLAYLAQGLPERFGGSARYRRIIEQHRPVVRSLEEELVGDIAGPLWVLLGTVAIVLLIACANVANLLIVRAESRRRDFALRRALGGGRARLIRSQMAEALLIAALGGAGGVLLAWTGVPVLVRAAPENIPRLSSVGLDIMALLFSGGITILAACVSGFLPAIRSSNPALIGALAESERVGVGPNQLTRNALVIVQTAAALVLLVGSGLLVQSFRALSRVDPGFYIEDIFTFKMAPDRHEQGLVDGRSSAQFIYSFMDRLAALPGVASVGVVNTLPLDEGAPEIRFATERTEQAGGGEELPLRLHFTAAGGDYFQTMGIELLSGSYFERNADPTSEFNVIVSRSAADLLWPRKDPLGKRIRPVGVEGADWMTVTGVVEDVMLSDFRQQAPDPLVYLPLVGQFNVWTPAYVVKSARAQALAPEIRDLIREVAPSAPMYRTFTMAGLAARSAARLTFTMLTLGVASGLALILGAIGLYGVLSYVVSRRTREIAIRMAVGAQARQVQRMVVAQGSCVTLVGVVVGVAAALLLTRVLESLLFGVGAIDLRTFLTMSGILIAVALLASYIPARRASAVDPMHVLRAE